MRERTIIYAPNVGAGGGLVLLRALLEAWPKETKLSVFLDERARDNLAIPANAQVWWCEPSFRSRLRAEIKLKQLATRNCAVFCFHNLPPVFKLSSYVRCYVHNPNLVGIVPTSHLHGWVRIRYAIERFIARHFSANIDRYIVQTPTMARALLAWYRANVRDKIDPSIEVMPFVDHDKMSQTRLENEQLPDIKWDFLYVSDGATHKNHTRLFEAWTKLAQEGRYPSLAVTLHTERDQALSDSLRELKAQYGLAITNLGQLPHDELLNCYRHTRALLFASYAESFGIPMLEANAVKLPILAAELDFVRDLCGPVETFDPFSSVSIARAVKRFLYSQSEVVTPLTPDAFVHRLIADDGKGTSLEPAVLKI